MRLRTSLMSALCAWVVSLTQTSSGQFIRCEPGQWGNLQYSTVFLDIPDSMLPLVPTPPATTMWRFPGIKTIPELGQYLERLVGNDPDVIRLFQQEIKLQELPDDDETRAFPTRRAILEAPANVRRKIYSALARFPENPYHYRPLFIDSQSPAEWFSSLPISDDTIGLIEKLSYPIGTSTLAFSDIPLLFENVRDVTELSILRRAITRTQAIVLKLQIPDRPEEIVSLAHYWTASARVKSTIPLFESLARAKPDFRSIDPSNFFPPIPNNYLYEFPSAADGMQGVFPDGIWTSLHFFDTAPNDPAFETADTAELLNRKFEKASPPLQFGDLLLFSDSQTGALVHACVFIADDIAFTKNDRSVLTPWILMKIENIQARFSMKSGIETTTWRPKVKAPY